MNINGEGQCIHQCLNAKDCSDAILSCYPYDHCIIRCIGAESCNHLQIDFLKGAATLDCQGFGSCKGIIMNAVEQYTFHHGAIGHRGPIFKYNVTQSSIHSQFEWFLSDFEFQDIMEIQQQDIEITPHYILAKNVLSSEIMDKIMESHADCDDKVHTEYREFGAAYRDVVGHQVTYMDDCIHEDVYQYVQSITLGMLKHIQQETISEFERLNISNNDLDRIKEYISDNWLYDWQTLIGLSNDLESRVIEYILYRKEGNLGWHTDDDSNFTMVIMLNEGWKGGLLRLRLNPWDKHEYAIHLNKNDIILFPSLTDHSVDSISYGQRHVLVVEWWNIGRAYRIGRTSTMEQSEDMEQIIND